MDMPVSKWRLWADVIIGWLLIAAVIVFIKVAIPRLQKRALSNDPGVPAGVQWTALGDIWGGDVSALTSSADGCLYAGMASGAISVSYTHLRAHETRHDLVCRLLLEKKKKNNNNTI